MKKFTLTLAAGATALLSCAGATSASAAGGGTPIAPVPANASVNADRAADTAAASGLLQRYAASKSKASGKAASTISPASIRRTSASVPVNVLGAEFVRSGNGPVGEFRYAVSTFTVGTEKASVASAPDPSGTWQAVNVASGDTEARMSLAAKGSPLLHEPQVDAWYAVRGSNVVALDQDARTAIGGNALSLDAYQRLVHGKYANKMPGSAYDKTGYAGGYAASTQPDAQQSGSGWKTAALPAGAVLLGAGVVVTGARRRRGASETA